MLNDIKDKRAIIKLLIMDYIHGNGFDSTPRVTENKTSIIVYCGYHYMNENGYYDGWFYMTIRFPKKKPLNQFRLTFDDDGARATRLGVRDLIEEYVAQMLSIVESEYKEQQMKMQPLLFK